MARNLNSIVSISLHTAQPTQDVAMPPAPSSNIEKALAALDLQDPQAVQAMLKHSLTVSDTKEALVAWLFTTTHPVPEIMAWFLQAYPLPNNEAWWLRTFQTIGEWTSHGVGHEWDEETVTKRWRDLITVVLELCKPATLAQEHADLTNVIWSIWRNECNLIGPWTKILGNILADACYVDHQRQPDHLIVTPDLLQTMPLAVGLNIVNKESIIFYQDILHRFVTACPGQMLAHIYVLWPDRTRHLWSSPRIQARCPNHDMGMWIMQALITTQAVVGMGSQEDILLPPNHQHQQSLSDLMDTYGAHLSEPNRRTLLNQWPPSWSVQPQVLTALTSRDDLHQHLVSTSIQASKPRSKI